mmetsp:Transcript_705/g.2004  ORF Transcript_705/g.2004 Transcript_705/m.2004 type:complete len:324 (-) Transcript_705:147-1118(-)
MFQCEMVTAVGSPGTFVAGHLLQCFKEPLLRVDEADTFSLYIDRDTFQEYLEGLDGATEAPDTVLLQHYAATARRMVRVGMAIEEHANSLSKLVVVLRRAARGDAVGDELVFATPDPDGEAAAAPWADLPVIVGGVMQRPDADTVRVRFPYHMPLFELFGAYFARNVPPELWLDQSWLDRGTDAAGRAELGRICGALQPDVEGALAALLVEGAGAAAAAAASTLACGSEADAAAATAAAAADVEPAEHDAPAATVRRWLWTVEDLALGHRLLHRGSDPLRLHAAVGGEGGEAVLADLLSTVLSRVDPRPPAVGETRIVLDCDV